MGTLANNEDPHEMQHYALFTKFKATFRDIKTSKFRKFYLWPLKGTMGCLILIIAYRIIH